MGVDPVKILARLRRRIRLLISRAVITTVNDSLKLQGLQITLLAGNVADEVESFQHYGFTSVPEDGAEAIALDINGHKVVIATGDRRHRKKGMAGGEVAVYHKGGGYLYFKESGDVELKAPGKVDIIAGADINVTAQGNANVTATGKVTVKGDGIDLDGGAAPNTGVVNGECVCAFTGNPHPQTSVNVKAGL